MSTLADTAPRAAAPAPAPTLLTVDHQREPLGVAVREPVAEFDDRISLRAEPIFLNGIADAAEILSILPEELRKGCNNRTVTLGLLRQNCLFDKGDIAERRMAIDLRERSMNIQQILVGTELILDLLECRALLERLEEVALHLTL